MNISIGFELETGAFALIRACKGASEGTYYIRPFPEGDKHMIGASNDARIEIYGDRAPQFVHDINFANHATIVPPIRLVGESDQQHGQRNFVITKTFKELVINDAEFVVTFPSVTSVPNNEVCSFILYQFLETLHLIREILADPVEIFTLTNRPPTFNYKFIIFPRDMKWGLLSTVPATRLTNALFTPQMTVGMNIRDVLSFMSAARIGSSLQTILDHIMRTYTCFNDCPPDRETVMKQVFGLIIYSLTRASIHRKEVSPVLLRSTCQDLLALLTNAERIQLLHCAERLPSDDRLWAIILSDVRDVLVAQTEQQQYDRDESHILAQGRKRIITTLQTIIRNPIKDRKRRKERQFLTDVGLIPVEKGDDRVFIEIRTFANWIRSLIPALREEPHSISNMTFRIDEHLVRTGYLE